MAPAFTPAAQTPSFHQVQGGGPAAISSSRRDQEEGHLGDSSSVAWTPTVPSENALPSGPCRGPPDWNQFAPTGRPPGGVSSHGLCASCPMQHGAAREPASHKVSAPLLAPEQL